MSNELPDIELLHDNPTENSHGRKRIGTYKN